MLWVRRWRGADIHMRFEHFHKPNVTKVHPPPPPPKKDPMHPTVRTRWRSAAKHCSAEGSLPRWSWQMPKRTTRSRGSARFCCSLWVFLGEWGMCVRVVC